MKVKDTPAMAVLVTLAMVSALLPGAAQLPPTNMGKYVHQPGDNQYSNQTQSERHGAPAPVQSMQMPIQSSAPAGYVPAPAPRKPDPTVEPIAADEPVPQPGFPPLPDRLDLFGSGGGGGGGGGGSNWTGGGGGGGYSGPSPGMAGGGGGGMANPTFHQHYGHMPPGAYVQNQGSTGSSYRAVNPGMPAGGGGGSSYRAVNPGFPSKAVSPGADSYSAGGTPAPPRYSGASSADFKALGREPKLNERDDANGMQAPEAPTPVVVSQSTTQDLSLPEDEFSYRHPNAAGKNQMKRTMTRMIKAPLNSVGGIAGVRF